MLRYGYGFGDEHVNAAIAKAIDHYGLRVFTGILVPNLWKGVLAALQGPSVWKGVSEYG